MAARSPQPAQKRFNFDEASLVRLWPRLHAGDAEPLPPNPACLQAWRLCHEGDFEAAARAGRQAGPQGQVAAHRALFMQAAYLESDEKTRLDMLEAVARQAGEQAQAHPDCAGAWYWQAAALGRYGQGISVAKALAQGLGDKVRSGFERAVQLQPRHADAHIGLGAFHAEVIDKIGEMIGKMTYGASRETGLRMFREGLRLHPSSPLGLLEAGHGLLMLQGDQAREEVSRLYAQALACQPQDAIEALVLQRVQAELQD